MWHFSQDDIILHPKIHSQTLVWLHGANRYAKQDARILEVLNFHKDTRVRIVAAPIRDGILGTYPFRGPSWCPWRRDNGDAWAAERLSISRMIDDILHEEYALCPNVFLGGFSQGGATAWFTAFVVSEVPLKGLVCLSSGPMGLGITRPSRLSLPVFFYYGTDDELIDYKDAEKYQVALKVFNITVKSERGLGHQYSLKEFTLVKKWMQDQIALPKL